MKKKRIERELAISKRLNFKISYLYGLLSKLIIDRVYKSSIYKYIY